MSASAAMASKQASKQEPLRPEKSPAAAEHVEHDTHEDGEEAAPAVQQSRSMGQASVWSYTLSDSFWLFVLCLQKDTKFSPLVLGI